MLFVIKPVEKFPRDALFLIVSSAVHNIWGNKAIKHMHTWCGGFSPLIHLTHFPGLSLINYAKIHIFGNLLTRPGNTWQKSSFTTLLWRYSTAFSAASSLLKNSQISMWIDHKHRLPDDLLGLVRILLNYGFILHVHVARLCVNKSKGNACFSNFYEICRDFFLYSVFLFHWKLTNSFFFSATEFDFSHRPNLFMTLAIRAHPPPIPSGMCVPWKKGKNQKSRGEKCRLCWLLRGSCFCLWFDSQ